MNRSIFIKENLENGRSPLVGNIIVINRKGEQINTANHSNEMENIMNSLALISMKDAVDKMQSYTNNKDEFGAIISDPRSHSYKKLLTEERYYRSDIIRNFRFNPDPATLIINSIIINKEDDEIIIEHTRLNTSVSGDINNIIDRIPIKTSNHSDIEKVLSEVIEQMKYDFNNPREIVKNITEYINNSRIGTKKSESGKDILGWE